MQKETKKTLKLSCRAGRSSINKGRRERSAVCPGTAAWLSGMGQAQPPELAFGKDSYYGRPSSLSFLFPPIFESSSLAFLTVLSATQCPLSRVSLGGAAGAQPCGRGRGLSPVQPSPGTANARAGYLLLGVSFPPLGR